MSITAVICKSCGAPLNDSNQCEYCGTRHIIDDSDRCKDFRTRYILDEPTIDTLNKIPLENIMTPNELRAAIGMSKKINHQLEVKALYESALKAMRNYSGIKED